MDRQHDYGAVNANQLDTLDHIGLFEKRPAASGPTLGNPYDPALGLAERARSYLHVNCSACHVEAGGGNARMELEFSRKLEDMRLIDARPQHANFGIGDAMLVAPGQPDRSVLVARVSRRGAGQMPPLCSRVVDEVGANLIKDWIASMPKSERAFVRTWTTPEVLELWKANSDESSLEQGKQLYRELGCIQCHRLEDEGGGAGPDLTRLPAKLSPEQLIQSIVEPSATIAPEYALTMIITADGRALSGRIEHENAELIRLRSPESFDIPITVKTADVDQRTLSKVSMMPAAILNSCSEQEVLDLIAYVLSPERQTDASPE